MVIDLFNIYGWINIFGWLAKKEKRKEKLNLFTWILAVGPSNFCNLSSGVKLYSCLRIFERSSQKCWSSYSVSLVTGKKTELASNGFSWRYKIKTTEELNVW